MIAFRWPTIAQGDRVIILGRSGSGKTEMLKALTKTQENAIVVDTKLNEDWSSVGRIVKGNAIFRVKRGRYVWETPDDYVTNPSVPEEFCARFYRAGPRMLVFDELLDTAPRAMSYPPHLKILCTRGRSAGIGLMFTTQRPYDVPGFTLSEAKHYFIFELALDKDRKRVEEVTGGVRLNWDAIAGQHGFYYIDAKGNVSGPSRLDLQGGKRQAAVGA